MPSLSVNDFTDYFVALHHYQPFEWQRRLCESVAATGEWPLTIDAPTGTGKSNVVDIHVFVNALYGWRACPRVPRRLAVVVNRRGIVDAHEQRALEILDKLRESDRVDVLDRVAGGLGRLQHHARAEDDVLSLVTLRGGLLPPRDWINDPATCTVMCATPDMWGSRILFNGYGVSRQARPREAGLLAYDTVMVLDEAHLNRQLSQTARRIRDLLQRHDLPAPALQVVETTATPLSSDNNRSAGVHPADLATDDVLNRRLSRPKPVTYHPTDLWPEGKRPPSAKYVDEIADLVIAAWNSTSSGTVGCVVNTVSTATRVAQQVADRLSSEASRGGVLTWVGPMRPMDLTNQFETYPEAFGTEGDPTVGVIVATQTIEVGIDIDFAALVTEVAPASSLVQRAGRVNRLGNRDSGPITIVGPAGTVTDSGPYTADELEATIDWIRDLEDDPAGLAFISRSRTSMPATASRREVLSRLEVGDTLALTATNEALAAPPDLALWLRDDLSPEAPTCGIVLRSNVPDNDVDAIALLRATPPAARETYPARIYLARDVLMDLRDLKGTHGRAFVWRDGSLGQVDLGADVTLRPGDVVVLDDDHPIIAAHTVVEYGEGSTTRETAWGEPGVTVLWRDTNPPLFKLVDDLRADPDMDNTDSIQELVSSAEGTPDDQLIQVTLGPPLAGDDRGDTPWIVLRTKKVTLDNEETRQTWVGDKSVTLDTHSQAVGARARGLGEHLGLSDAEVGTLELAGLHHDLGKQDKHFQRMLDPSGRGEVLAKSGGRSSRAAQMRKAASGLPAGWRHEQLSVLLALDHLDSIDSDQRDLTLRLIGTSHGWGRSGFPHNARELVVDAEPSAEAVDLFDNGGWETLVETTERRLGPWGCAFYEALLRAADCSVSKEGS